MEKAFLPISKKDMKERGWEQCDFVYVIGDAYVDHSSFGPAIISRLLGGVWLQSGDHFTAGLERRQEYYRAWRAQTRLFWCRAGNMDSMVNHYTCQ